VLLGQGNGSFQVRAAVPVGLNPFSLVVADVNSDGHPDLATADAGSNDVRVLLGRGDGTFQVQAPVLVGLNPRSLAIADINGDGRLDLATANEDSGNVSILLGQSDGSFQVQARLTVGLSPHTVVTADFNGDGRLDLATIDAGSNEVSILLGQGDGSFQVLPPLPVGLNPFSLLVADLNKDGRLDLVTANAGSDDVSVLLGRGDGTFQIQAPVPVGSFPFSLVVADLNGDGHLDLATANAGSSSVSILLGRGDGSFQVLPPLSVGSSPLSLVVADVNRDGHPDLIAAGSDSVSILLGRGDGSFQVLPQLPVGSSPLSLVVADFNGDGRPDLATPHAGSNNVSVLLGRGDGSFEVQAPLPVGLNPVSPVVADFNGDGHLDLAIANEYSDDVSVLLGRGGGTFQAQVRVPVGDIPTSLAVADVNGDGHPDLIVANANSNNVSVLLGRGDGSFSVQAPLHVGVKPLSLVLADVNGDGRLDLVTANEGSNDVSVLLGRGDGSFVDPSTVVTASRAIPRLADLTGDGVPDSVILSQDGSILFRAGRPHEPGVFDPPIVVNPDLHFAARDVALVKTSRGIIVAALDAKRSGLSLYAYEASGAFTRMPGPDVPGTLPTRIVAGDLNSDGLEDLAVLAAGSSQVYIYLQSPDGSFVPAGPPSPRLGVGPAEIALVDVNGDGKLDIVVTNRSSGDVSVLLNASDHPFATELRFRAGTGLYGLETRDGAPAVRSLELPAGMVAGDFDGDHVPDLVVTDSGSNRFTFLRGDGNGGFFNPIQTPAFFTGSSPTVVAAGRFNQDPYLDLAVLDEGSREIQIFLGNGAGGFTRTAHPVDPGNAPTGLSLADVNGDGYLDLLIGNRFGDVLILLGKGDGTFQPYQRIDQDNALAVADLNGDGRDDIVLANESLDRVSVVFGDGSRKLLQEKAGLLAPGAVRLADLNRDGKPDLVVANRDGNDILVYLGIGNGQFGPAQSFFAGTNPVGITLAYLNDQRVPVPPIGAGPISMQLGDPNLDLVVANEGSNDVTILLGRGQGATWTLTPGPRLRVGTGPVSTLVQDFTGDGVPDLLVSNSRSNNLFLLKGLGAGFFDDQNPKPIPLPASPGPFLESAPGAPPIVAVPLPSANRIAMVPNPVSGAPPHLISTGGSRPVAGIAGDFNHDGVDDLIIANNGDGLISVLLGGPEGLTLRETLSSAEVRHPTDLALSPSGQVLYVTGEGEETLARFDLSALNAASLPPPSSVIGPTPPVVQSGGGLTVVHGQTPILRPVDRSALVLVVTLLTGIDEAGSGLGADAGAAADASLLALTNRAAFTAGSGANEESEVPDPDAPTVGTSVYQNPDTVRRTEADLINFRSGVDERLTETPPRTPPAVEKQSADPEAASQTDSSDPGESEKSGPPAVGSPGGTSGLVPPGSSGMSILSWPASLDYWLSSPWGALGSWGPGFSEPTFSSVAPKDLDLDAERMFGPDNSSVPLVSRDGRCAEQLFEREVAGVSDRGLWAVLLGAPVLSQGTPSDPHAAVPSNHNKRPSLRPKREA
jgi:hypothetical protein